MKYTLLELVQDIASSLDSDEINGINDSVEAQQIATIVRTAYFDLISRLNLPEQHDLFSLSASGDSTKPVLMTLPSDVKSIKWLQYDGQTTTDPNVNFQDVNFLQLKTFLDRINGLNPDESTVGSMSHGGFTFYYRNNVAPIYYTTFDDNTVIFDSYDNTVDTTLQTSKTRCYGLKTATWEMSNTFRPDLDEAQFALLLNEAKSLAWTELKQTVHSKAEMNARRLWIKSQKSQNNFKEPTDFDNLPNFGRR